MADFRDDQYTAERYPLSWPIGRPRSRNRKHAQFKQAGSRIGIPAAIKRLETELDRIKGQNPVLSSNLRVRLSGDVVANAGEPGDAGVALYFSYKGKARVFASDQYYRVADNITAIAMHIEALRAIERHGVGTIEQALEGFKALPVDSASNWRAVFGFKPEERPSLDALDSAYKTRAKEAHPDRGGSDVAMAHINRARDYALQELRS